MAVKLPAKPSVMAATPQDHIMLFFGPPGTGKTKFVEKLAPKVLFLSTDRGTRTYKMFRVECSRWKHFTEALSALEAGEQKYDIVCLDHVDDFANMAEEEVCRVLKISSLSDGPYGKGWKAYRDTMRGIVQRILRLGVGVVFIAHEDQKTIKQGGLERTISMPSMSKSAWKVIVPMVDIVGYTSIRRVTVGKGDKASRKDTFTLQTKPTADIYAKDRTRRRRPDGQAWELLDGKAFVESFTHGQENQQKQAD